MVRLVREECRSPSELAREFEPSAQSTANWVVQAEIDDGKRGVLTTDEKAGLRRLRAEKANFSIKFMCERLGVIRRGFYARRRRPPCQRRITNAACAAIIKKIHATHGATMGRRGSALSSQTTTTSAAAANGSPG